MEAIRGNIDKVELGNGFALVEGWCVTGVGGNTPSGLLLKIAECRPIALRNFFLRDDLVNAGVAAGAAAFRVEVPTFQSRDTVEVQILSARAEAVLCRSIEVRKFTPSGAIDRADIHGVSGWVFDPATWLLNSRPTIVVDGAIDIPLNLEDARPDLAAIFGKHVGPLGFRLRYDDLLWKILASPNGALLVDGGEHRLDLYSSNVRVAQGAVRLMQAGRGNLESFRDGKLRGWAVREETPETPAAVNIEVDGITYVTTSAGQAREDLAQKGISKSCGGFSVPLRLSPTGSTDIDVTASVAGATTPLSGSPVRITGLHVAKWTPDWPRILQDPDFCTRRVTVIVPVYNAADELSECLESLVRHTTYPCRIIVIDDASPDPAVREVLDKFCTVRGIQVIRNESNMGFVRTCNFGMELATEDDIVLLNSDVAVTPRWLENLRLAAYSRSNIGTVTPLSDNAGVFSAPEINQPNAVPPGLSISDVGRLVTQASASLFPTVPTGNGFCLYIRNTCLKQIGLFDALAFPRGYGEENDFCMRAARAGFQHILDDRTYMHHKRSASFKEEKAKLYEAGQDVLQRRYPEYKVLTEAFLKDEILLGVRWRIRKALRSCDAQVSRPRILFVISTETGGTPQTNSDLMNALKGRYEAWLLRCDASRITVSRLSDQSGSLIQVESYDLSVPIRAADHRSEEYNRIVCYIMVRYAIELVHIRHIAWHSIDLISLCRQLSIPTIFSFHDYYTICPSVKLLDTAGNPCCLGPDRTPCACSAELWDPETVPPLKPDFVDRWRSMMAEALRCADAFVTTCVDAHERLCRAHPFLREADFRVIPHGRDFERMQVLGAPATHGRPLRVLVPGNLSAAKGANVVRDLAAVDEGRTIEFHILGDSGTLIESPGIIIHGRYKREEFHARVQQIRPSIGAIFSLWPETYCHTLTEMWSCGLPVLAFQLGAVGERIGCHGGGWLVKAGTATHELLRVLRTLPKDNYTILQKVCDVIKWQKGSGSEYGVGQMAAGYDELYRSKLMRRLFQAT